MAQKKHTPEQIIRKLREVEVAQGKGKTIPQAVKQISVTEQTFYRWRKNTAACGWTRPSGSKSWRRKTSG